MAGYAVCSHCRKFLFEEDFEKKDNEGKCRWCDGLVDMNSLNWRGVNLPRRRETDVFKGE